jgi:IMP dehydrogenase
MASKEARKSNGHEGNNAEGVSRQVTCKPEGSTEEIFNYLQEGIRSAMSYTGVSNLRDFIYKAKFIQVTKAGLDQAHPHFKDH